MKQAEPVITNVEDVGITKPDTNKLVCGGYLHNGPSCQHPDHRHPEGVGDLFESLMRGLNIWDMDGDLVTWIGPGVDEEEAEQEATLPHVNGWYYRTFTLPTLDGESTHQVPFITYRYATTNLMSDLRAGVRHIPPKLRQCDSHVTSDGTPRLVVTAQWPGWLIERDSVDESELREVRKSLGLEK